MYTHYARIHTCISICIYIYICIYICIHLIKRFLRFFSTIVKRHPIHGERTPPKSRLLSKVSRVPIPWHTVDRYLIGGIHAPLKNISQIGSSSQLLGEIKKKVPNHQPGIILTTEPNNSRLSQAAKKCFSLTNQPSLISCISYIAIWIHMFWSSKPISETTCFQSS